jgi:uncharacterized protein Veg
MNEHWENDMKSITANIGEKIEVKDNNGDIMGKRSEANCRRRH